MYIGAAAYAGAANGVRRRQPAAYRLIMSWRNISCRGWLAKADMTWLGSSIEESVINDMAGVTIMSKCQ
jgi:hypothetical protein